MTIGFALSASTCESVFEGPLLRKGCRLAKPAAKPCLVEWHEWHEFEALRPIAQQLDRHSVELLLFSDLLRKLCRRARRKLIDGRAHYLTSCIPDLLR
jgi:hypothetical protein